MAFHEGPSLKLMMGNPRPPEQTCSQRDLDATAATNLRTEGYRHGSHRKAPAARRK